MFLHYLSFSILIYSSCANFCTQGPITKIALFLCECVRERLLGTMIVGTGRYAATFAKEARTYIGQINCSRERGASQFCDNEIRVCSNLWAETKQRHVVAHSGPFVICFFCFHEVMSRRPLMRSNNIHARRTLARKYHTQKISTADCPCKIIRTPRWSTAFNIHAYFLESCQNNTFKNIWKL